MTERKQFRNSYTVYIVAPRSSLPRMGEMFYQKDDAMAYTLHYENMGCTCYIMDGKGEIIYQTKDGKS